MKEKIRKWLITVIADKSWERFNDLHIDEVDPMYESKDYWVKGGLECYLMATCIINEMNLPYTLELSYHLKSKSKRGNYIIKDMKSLYRELEDTPPSLYLHPNNWSHLLDIRLKGTKLEAFVDDNRVNGHFYYYQVFHQGDREVRRVLYLV